MKLSVIELDKVEDYVHDSSIDDMKKKQLEIDEDSDVSIVGFIIEL